MMMLIKNPEILPPGILKTKVDLAAISADWPSFLGFIEMATSAAGIILFGFAASWIFGREYSDRTVKDLLALSVSRTAIVFSKIIALWLWCLLSAVVIFVISLGTGALINLPLWSPDLMPEFFRVFFVSALLSLLLCPVVAFVASMGRGFLPAIGFLIFCMGLANLFANIGVGEYFPWAIPMLYSNAVEDAGNGLPLASYIIIVLTCLAGIIGTVYRWKYADQNR
ncbi:MAG: bacitracin ABC transporter permease [Spirochaetaceae bacterium]|nr:MAG: bacitracin ABC transporter permease [Spirochaetaceae bacterium]